jgi:hypothetical protein
VPRAQRITTGESPQNELKALSENKKGQFVLPLRKPVNFCLLGFNPDASGLETATNHEGAKPSQGEGEQGQCAPAIRNGTRRFPC